MMLTTEKLSRIAESIAFDADSDPLETAEWLESLQAVLETQGADRVRFLLQALQEKSYRLGVKLPFTANTPYINTIPYTEQPAFPGDRELERRIKSIIRWNAMAMVVKANRKPGGVGGHIATFASAATLYEIGFNHFFRGRTDKFSGDIIYFQGHASPGMYARAFVEGRLSAEQLENFRRELAAGGGLSSYPHPWLMPNFWQYPTVSMGLGPLMAIYHARFNRYLTDRGLSPSAVDSKVWAFLGDGECDEPETLGAISLAAREKLENLIFVINCNLQRLDGPVRGNGKIIQELEGVFRGAGWNVIKVVWGSDWDPLLARDDNGVLLRRMGEFVDGEYQELVGRDMRTPEEVEKERSLNEERDKKNLEPIQLVDDKELNRRRGAFIREKFFSGPELKELVRHLSDEQLAGLKRGGHDPLKVFAAYKAAVENKGSPTVILVKTVKGYGLAGQGGEGKNTTHQLKAFKALSNFRDRFHLPLSDEQVFNVDFYRPPADSPEMKYLLERRKALGGFQPFRNNEFKPSQAPKPESFAKLHAATTEGKSQSTTLAWVILMTGLMRDPNIGKHIVPIVPDEGQTFGMPPMYNLYGIYSHAGQKYTPVDAGTATAYKESRTGQILQEGINEAGSMASFIAAGTAYSTHGVNTIPFYIYYSMFGFQRIGDLVWAAADSRCKGFLVGATAGRTTLNGEGLQHEDGHSQVWSLAVPNLLSYDPSWAYELAVIIEDGINRMYVKGEDVFYYLTVYNEPYDMPAMPADPAVREGIIRGLYKFRPAANPDAKLKAQLLGSGVILNQVLDAQKLLEKYGVAADVYSAPSYQQLRRDWLETERWNRLHPDAPPRQAYVQKVLGGTPGPVIASSDYMRTLPEQIAPALRDAKGPRMLALGTDGFGRSETRPALRRFFEVDAESVAVATLYALAERGELDRKVVKQAIADLKVDPERPAPWTV
jgi:pyruvate dehydrogenase E1 component